MSKRNEVQQLRQAIRDGKLIPASLKLEMNWETNTPTVFDVVGGVTFGVGVMLNTDDYAWVNLSNATWHTIHNNLLKAGEWKGAIVATEYKPDSHTYWLAAFSLSITRKQITYSKPVVIPIGNSRNIPLTDFLFVIAQHVEHSTTLPELVLKGSVARLTL